MARNLDHDMLVPPTAEEAARQRFVLAFKQHLGRHLRPRNRTIYEAGAKPRFEARHGRAPQSFEEIAQSLYGEPLYQTWCSLNRTAQEMMWDAVSAPIDREGDQLSRRFRERSGAPDRRGSLRLNPALELPDGLARVHVHLQPDGYLADTGEDDVRAGALYEAGGALYSQGQSIGTMESKADCVVRFLADRHPGLEPTRILDMACSAGSSTVPYALAFPEAEVHGVDVAPAMLRYAHARAEALGVAIHFHQMSVARTDFDDATFDLVVSHNGMHEMSRRTQRAMMAESFRLLRPGGVCVHQDVPLRFEELDTFMQVERSWDKWFNGELFWEDYAANDCAEMLTAAGFEPASIFTGYIDQKDSSMRWYAAAAAKPA